GRGGDGARAKPGTQIQQLHRASFIAEGERARAPSSGQRRPQGHLGAMGGSARHQAVVDGGAGVPDAVTGSTGSPSRGVTTASPRLAASSTSVSAGSDQAW